MLHLKNITSGNPKTAEQYELTKRYGVEWLYTESGENWYEIQKNFSPDTLKVEYLDTGKVTWVGKDAASINPRNRSVIEITDNTANRQIDASGYWFYRDDKFIFDYSKKAEDERVKRLKDVSRLPYYSESPTEYSRSGYENGGNSGDGAGRRICI
ncbi:tail fiber assembly protein [Escherichia coli]|nr:tail fiber assembly protein [Escherichia coli]